MKIACVYKIENTETHRVYIGSTKSFIQRRYSHLSALRNNKHSNKEMQEDFNKYGESKFKFEEIERIYDLTILKDREQFWLDRQTDCYNICPDTKGMTGFKHSESTKYLFSLTRKGQNNGMYGKHLSEEQKLIISNCQKELQQGENNTFYGKKHSDNVKKLIGLKNGLPVKRLEDGKIFNSCMDAQRQLGVNHTGIMRCCNGRQETSGGYHWMYLKDEVVR